MTTDFETEVIDRLARIEVKQEQITNELEKFHSLEERVTALEAEENKRKGKGMVSGALLLVLIALMGGVAGVITGRILP